MKKLIALSAFAVLLITGANAVDAQTTVSPGKEKLIRELFAVTRAKDEMEKSIDLMLSFQKEENLKMFESLLATDTVLSEADKESIREKSKASSERILKTTKEFFSKEGNEMESMMDEALIPLYEKTFTEQELRDLIAFHKTSAAQKSIKVLPEVLSESMAVMTKFMPKLTDMINKLITEEFAQLKQEAQAPKKKAAPKS